MARKKTTLTAEERDRIRRVADERHAEVREAVERAATFRAQTFLRERGVMQPGDSVVDRLRRLDRYRRTLNEQAQIRYQPTMRQQQARPAPGLVEVEF